MKKLFLLLFLLLPCGVFAGADTDRICTDGTKYGIIHDSNFRVSYPGEVASVSEVLKTTKLDNINDNNMNINQSQILYYVVNVGEGQKKRAELYSYNCTTKSPKLLLTEKTKKDTIYILALETNTNILLTEVESREMGLSFIKTLIGYDFYTNKKLFSFVNRDGIIGVSKILGFVIGRDAWYIYYQDLALSEPRYIANEKLLRIHKKTLKATQL